MSADFLSRWARRKAEAKQAASIPGEEAAPATELEPGVEDAAEDAPPPEPAAGELAGSPADMTAEEIAELPPVGELTSSSDLAPFLRAGVPTLLRNAALRRMWTVDPGIRDFLNDAREYAYDWNTPGGVPGLGPLRPSDDVKAMVRRIFDGSGGPAAAKEEDVASDAETPSPLALSEVEHQGQDGAQEALADDATSLEQASAPPDEPPSAAPVPAERVGAEAANGSLEPAPRRLRRHGGAAPA